MLTGLIMSCMAALSATMYGMASCRFLYIDFLSDRGDFGEFYLDPTSDGDPIKYRAGAGLYTWLTSFEADDWSQGRCVGYTVLQRDAFGDIIFEVARVFGVLSVLGGIGITSWTLFLSCLSLRKLQIWAMSLGLFLLATFVGLTLILFQSQLCQDLVSYQDGSYTTKCTLDQGGLVAIAGCLFWCVAFFITVCYIKPPENDIAILPDGRITNLFDDRQLERERQRREKQKRVEQERMQRAAESSIVGSKWSGYNSRGQQKSTASSPPQIDCFEDDGVEEVELQLGSHRGNAR